MLPNFSYVRPETLNKASHHLVDGAAVIHAGGTDLLGCLHDGVFGADKVVSLGGFDSLRGIRRSTDGGLRIGALTSISEVAGDERVLKRYPALAEAAAEVASPQLRNQGTLGGNICQKPRCWYYRGEFDCLRKGGKTCFAVGGENQYHCILGGKSCFIVHPSDTAPALLALNAEVKIASYGGERSVPLADFHVPPAEDPQKETVLKLGEIVTEIILPPPAGGLYSRYRKIRSRQAWDFALAGMALALDMEGDRVKTARIVLSGAAPVPWRSEEAEDVVTGRSLNEKVASEAASAALKPAKALGKNGYKLNVFRGMIEEELLRAGGG